MITSLFSKYRDPLSQVQSTSCSLNNIINILHPQYLAREFKINLILKLYAGRVS